MLFIVIILFPPYVQWRQSMIDGPRARVGSGWAFVGGLSHNQEIRWSILALEVIAVAGLAATAGLRNRRPPRPG